MVSLAYMAKKILTKSDFDTFTISFARPGNDP